MTDKHKQILQTLSEEQRARRVEDIAVLLSGGFDEKTVFSRGYSQEEIREAENILKGEERNMKNLKEEEVRGIITDGFKVGTTIIEPVPSVIDKCLNVTSDSNTGIAVIPIISETGINYVEVKAIGLEKEIIISQEVMNCLSEEDVKTQLDIMVNIEKENRLAVELETVASTGSTIEDLFTLDTKYISDNYIMCNKIDLGKIAKLKLGSEMALEYKRINDKLVPVINEVPVLVNDNLTKVVLFTPAHIGISNFALDQTEEIVTTPLVRAGKKMYRRLCGMQPKVLITDSIKAITLA